MPSRPQRNLTALELLHPAFRALVCTLLARLEAQGVKPLIVQGRRTWAEQSALYSQGRTTDGPKVTNARAGFSWHNYSLAIDLVDVAASGNPDAYDASDWNTTNYPLIAKEAKALGMEWGGAWRSFVDRPHLEWHPGYGAGDAFKLATRVREDETLQPEFFDGVTA